MSKAHESQPRQLPCYRGLQVKEVHVTSSTSNEWGRVLVIVTEELLQTPEPATTPLAQRALEVARRTGAELEFFHVYHDQTFDWPALSSDKEIVAMRESLVDNRADLLAEFVVRLPVEGLTVRHEVRWDKPQDDAILRKAVDCGATLIMKASRDHRYFIGLVNHLDWSLVRAAPVPVWFVKDEYEPIDGIVSSIGTQSDGDDVFEPLDEHVVEITRALGLAWDLQPQFVHTYEVPQALPNLAHHAASFSVREPSMADERGALRERILTLHEDATAAFTRRVDLPPGSVDLYEGHAGNVLPAIARQRQASLLVIGVQNRGFWERLAAPVTAEPVLANSQCDVLCVRHGIEAAESLDADIISGTSTFDLERAITSPSDVFERPRAVLDANLGNALKRRILQTWRLDLHVFITDQNEGGLNSEPYLEQLEEVNECLRGLTPIAAPTAPRASHG